MPVKMFGFIQLVSKVFFSYFNRTCSWFLKDKKTMGDLSRWPAQLKMPNPLSKRRVFQIFWGFDDLLVTAPHYSVLAKR